MRLAYLFCVVWMLSAAASASAQHVIANEPVSITYKTVKRQKGKYYRINITYPVFPDNIPTGRLANRLIRETVSEEQKAFLEDEKAMIQTAKELGVELWLEMRPRVMLARRTLISLYFDVSTFGGGAHPNRYFHIVNVGMVGGKPKALRLADILWENMDPAQVFTDYVVPPLNRAKAERGWPPFVREELGYETDSEMLSLWDRFVIAPQEVVWLFEPYSVGPFAEGSYVIRVPKQQLERLLKISW